jgi:hypothetical protein
VGTFDDRIPPMPRTLLLIAAATCALAGCATAAPPDGGPYPPKRMCNAEAARAAIGREATPDVVERARIDAGADMARVLRPGQVVTMEYREGRLNIDVNERNAIIGLRCG